MEALSVGAFPLTEAELRLVPLLATNRTFADIAERLCVSRNTVKSQSVSIYHKLGVSSRTDAANHLRRLAILADC